MLTPTVLLCLVIAVNDGASIRVRCDEGEGDDRGKGKAERSLRIGGIDAPELRQPAGAESRGALTALCQGEQAQVVMRAHDAQGRAVADVACRGVDVAAAQAGAGWAWVTGVEPRGVEPRGLEPRGLEPRSTEPRSAEPLARSDLNYRGLEALQASARAQRRGLWARPNPQPPWEWRRAQQPPGRSA